MSKIETLVNAVERFSIEIDQNSGQYYFSVPVSNQLVDYEEYYEVTQSEYINLVSNPALAIRFAADFRARRLDARLMTKPGADRSV